MLAVGPPELLLLGLLLLGALALAWRSRSREPVTREVRLVGATRVVGILLGLAAARAVSGGASGPTLAPAVFGTTVLVAVVLGETLVRPRRPGGARSASLGVRRVRDHLPRVTWAVGAVTVLTGVLLTLTTLPASPDATSGELTVLSCDTGTFGSSAGPYPGAHYSLPLAAGLLLVLVVAAVAARQVVLRPRGAGPDHTDDDLRRRSLGVVVAAAGVAVGMTYLGAAATAAGAMSSIADVTPSCAAAWVGPTSEVLGLSCVPVAVLAMGCTLQLLRPRPVRSVAPREAAGVAPR